MIRSVAYSTDNMIILMILSTLLVLILTILYWSQRKFDHWKKKNVKFPKPVPFLGNYGEYILQRTSFGEIAQKICQQYPDEPIVGAFFGTEPVILIQDPELIKVVTIKDYYYFNSREIAEHSHNELLTRNMFFTYGDNWKVLRQNLTPLFSSSKMKNMFHLIEKCSKVYEKMLDDEVKKSNVCEVRNMVIRYTMDCICSCGFGIDTNVMGDNVGNNPFRKMGDAIFGTSMSRGIKIIFRAVWPATFYRLGLKLFPEELNKFFTKILFNVFEERKGIPSSRQDFVDHLMVLKNNNYIVGDSIKNMKGGTEKERVQLKVDDDLLVAQSIMLFGAGFETSSTTASFTLFELAKNPQHLQRCLEEVDAYMSTHTEVAFDCTTEVPYLDQCIDETLRLYPVLAVITREVYEDYTLPNGVHLEKGMRVHLPVYHIQRHPKHFPDPEEFKPERFSPENKKNIIPHTYFPFGDGPRSCTGQRFAKMQMLAGLITFLKKYTVELADDMPTKLEFEPSAIVPQSKFGIKLKLIEREGWQQRMFKTA